MMETKSQEHSFHCPMEDTWASWGGGGGFCQRKDLNCNFPIIFLKSEISLEGKP